MKLIIITSILFFSLQISNAQDYNHVDSIVDLYPQKFNTIQRFATRVNKDFNTDIDKIRAVYYWVSNHIAYDYKSLKDNSNGYKSIESNTDAEYKIRLLTMQKKYAERALRRRLAVCEGYSQLLKFTLLNLGIDTEVIKGYAKTKQADIGRIRNNTNHAWNAVKLNNKWQLIDATWSAGNDEREGEEYDFTDTYFLISPEKLILSHFPKDKKWQLLETPITKANYFFKPIYYEPYYKSGLKLNEKQLGLIKVKKKDFIEITFDTIDETNDFYSYSLSKNGESKRLLFIEKNGKHITKIPFNSVRKSVVTIFNHFAGAIEFKIIIQN